MKKISFSTFFLTCVLLLTFVSCQKETVTLKARISVFSGDDKTFIGGNDGRTPQWVNGDQVWINGASFPVIVAGNSASIEDVPNVGDFRAVYPASIVDWTNDINSTDIRVSLGSTQTYMVDASGHQVVEAPMAAWSDNTNLTFTNLGALLAINLSNTTTNDEGTATLWVDKIEVESATDNMPLWGTGHIENFTSSSRRYVLDNTDNVQPNDPRLTLTLDGIHDVELNASSANSETLYVHIPASTGAVQNRFRITIYAHSATCSVVYSREQGSDALGNIGLNHVACVPLSLNSNLQIAREDRWVPEGCIDARFSISATQQCRFSQGNLQYQASTGTWRFAEKQDMFIGEDANVRASATSSDYIDLFAWATSGYHDGNDTYVFHWMPYEGTYSRLGRADYDRSEHNSYGYGPSVEADNNGDVTAVHDFSDNPDYDWGRNFISNGSDADWRTLTEDEWDYLLNSRFGGDRSKCARFCGVVIDDQVVRGILIFPDDYADFESLVPLYYDNLSEEEPIYSSIPNRTVFLPRAGKISVPTNLNGSTYMGGTYDGSCGYYWTASVNIRYNPNATAMSLAVNTTKRIDGSPRVERLSVRLITTSESPVTR